LAIMGAFLTWQLSSSWNLNPLVAALIALPIMGGVGWAMYHLVLARSIRAGQLIPLLTTFGLSIVIQNGLLQQYSPDVRSLGSGVGRLATGSWKLSDSLSVPYLGVLMLVVAVVVLGGLQLILHHTPFGREMRATAQDADTAALVGIPSSFIYAQATAIAISTAALAGAFIAIRSSFDPLSGPPQLLFAFEAVVIGGIGSLWGTLVGGIVLGVAQTVGATIDPQYSILAGHIVFLVVLLAPRNRALLAVFFRRPAIA
jgi:branched-chain amino acid transport system permease protein